MKFTNLKTSRKLGVAFFAIVATIVAMCAVIFWNLTLTTNAQRDREAATQAFAAAKEAQYRLSRQENSLRGFLLTGDVYYVERLESHRADFDRQLDILQALKSDDTRIVVGIDSARSAINAWWTDVVEEGKRLAADPITRFRAVEMSGRNGIADTFMEQIENALDGIITRVEEQITIAGDVAEAAGESTEKVLYVGLGFSVLISLGLGFLLSRMIAAPVTALTGVMGRLAGGDNSVVVPAVSRRDEIGEMARAVEVFKQAALAKLRAEAEAA
ncbi:CHASE3 domain-containing protein, partial [Aquamicrobium sp. LC103]|uniref:CHASE3 domain-containing protein n=1 Tax=Aquamicrobium sp. LC103 TaxID=1120658 RepID=UPI0010C93E8B